MDKLNMQTQNLAEDKFKKLQELFPNAVTEVMNENGEIEKAIDKDVLMQEISSKVVEGREERYQFTWPDKKQSILAANAPISKTLRPCRDESKNFDTTENLYIEGDNLEVLKLLQETYLGKIKMIYIDPPYNTGNDFVYNDDFKQTTDEYLEDSGQFDEEGNRFDKNLESNGRFHTDWLNMIYPRLKLARNLLSDDGVIFISIDDNEQANLKKVCDEVFGEKNFIGKFNWIRKKREPF
nr:site-specific DNA-methyltransferase [uncultured Finegoldia sp.]